MFKVVSFNYIWQNGYYKKSNEFEAIFSENIVVLKGWRTFHAAILMIPLATLVSLLGHKSNDNHNSAGKSEKASKIEI